MPQALRIESINSQGPAWWGSACNPRLFLPAPHSALPTPAVSQVHEPAGLPLDTGPFLILVPYLPGTHNTFLHQINSNSFLRSQLRHHLFRKSLWAAPSPALVSQVQTVTTQLYLFSQCVIIHFLGWFFVHCLHCFSGYIKVGPHLYLSSQVFVPST